MPAKYAGCCSSLYIWKEIYVFEEKTHKSLFIYRKEQRLSKIRDDLRDLEYLFWQKVKLYCFIITVKIRKSLEKRGETRSMYFMQMCSCLKICLWTIWQYLDATACWNGGYIPGGCLRYRWCFHWFICFWCALSITGSCIFWSHILF